ncbi:MAG: hybrid sensor histidine kinase/response regulator [Ferruginibacter sp.]|nr:hybrid sensor histidine kinase/response regulator [Ferruginibacter sp.]
MHCKNETNNRIAHFISYHSFIKNSHSPYNQPFFSLNEICLLKNAFFYGLIIFSFLKIRLLRHKINILIVVVFFVSGLSGQSYYFRHYQVENGLSNNATICSLQDTKGFLWFGTKDGLDRFDGYSFKVFRNSPDDSGSIGNNFIHCLYEDANGMLWAGTENGLYGFDAITEKFNLLQVSAGAPIRDISMDSKGNLWFIWGFTLSKYNAAKKTLEQYDISNHFEATSLCITSNGTLWASTTGRFIEKYDSAKNKFTPYDVFSHSPPAVSKWIERVYATTQGKIMIGTSNQGAKVFDINTNTYQDILSYNPNKTQIFVRNFVQNSQNEFWIATESGIFIYNIESGHVINLQKKYNDPYSISDNAVYCFVKDNEGSIWAGTYFGGVNYYSGQNTHFKKFFPRIGENGLSGNVVREIHEDHDGNLWIGTEDAGLNKYDTATKLFTHFQPAGNKESISSTNIHGIFVNGNELWIGTFENGLDVLNIKTRKVIRHYSEGTGNNSLKSNFIFHISKMSSGEIVLGTTRGAYAYNATTNDFSVLPGMPLNNWYTHILKDNAGTVWASTYGNGVNYYNGQTGTAGNFRYDVANKNSLSSDRVNSLFEDSKKNLWFATENGLCKLNKGSRNFKRYTTQNGFPSDFILSLVEDEKNNNLWISTSKGLVCFNPLTEQSTVYSRANGILSDQFNFNSAYKDNAGKMYFGSVKGLIAFHPDEFIKDAFIPPVYITGFQIFNKELTIAKEGSPLKKSITHTDKIVLNYNQSTFSIDFAALSYTAPEMSEYAYKMTGLDRDWIYLKTNRKVYFTELAPGTYIFKVKASNSSGNWNELETALTIQIHPPWWLSNWAYFFYTLAVILIIYFLIRNYHRKIEEKNRRKIEYLEIAKEKEIFQAKIEFFTNVAHEIRTPLTLIKGPLEKVIRNTREMLSIKDSLKIMERNTNRLIDLSNQLLDFRQTEIQGFRLNFAQADITELLEETYLNFKPLAEQKNLSFQMDLPSNRLMAFVDAEAFTKILTNLFNNAVKYADKKVMVCLLPFTQQDKSFTIEIENDGYLVPVEMKEKIFEPFFRLKETERQKGTGIGLALSRSLAELHKGVLDFKASNGLNVFFLTIPIHQEALVNMTDEPKKEPAEINHQL